MKALVTGVGGFIGQAVAGALLAEGHQVAGLLRDAAKTRLDETIRRSATLTTGSVCDFESVRKAAEGCDVLFHCAAVVGPQNYVQRPVETMDVEVMGLRNVCQAALELGARVVYPSSSAVYGGAVEGTPLTEDGLVAPSSSYAVAKRFNELYLKAQHDENGLSSAILRIFNVYGPGQSAEMVVPKFITLMMAGQPIPLFGGGRQTRDFVHVDEAARIAVLSAASDRSFDILNVGSGRPTSIAELAQALSVCAERPVRIEALPTPSHRMPVEVFWSVADTRRLSEHLGYVPGMALQDGLKTCLEGIRS